MQKADLRAMVRRRWQGIAPDERRRLSALLAHRIACHPAYASAHTVMLYHALPDEPDLAELLAHHGRKTIVLPLVTGPTTMEARLYTGPHSLRQGAFGIMEPVGEPLANLGDIDMVVVPGVAFDRLGHRLGRGRGYYDRFLPMLTRAFRLGVCLSHQLMDSVPTNDCDAIMHEVMWQ